jgi:hypothetical protein
MRRALLLIIALLAAGCGGEEPAPGFTPLATPDGPRSGQPRLASDGDRLLLSWVERNDTTAALRFAWWDGNAWTEPRTAASGAGWFVNWADTPGVVPAGDGRLAAFYLERTGPQPYAYGIRIVQSSDDGATWGPPAIPHAPDIQSEFGFVSVATDPAGDPQFFWLDGEHALGGHHGGEGAMALRTARLAADGRVHDAALLDDRVCDCCPTSAARTASGVAVAYRDRSADEIRDVAVARSDEGGWRQPGIPHADGWRIEGCPVNGPALVTDGARLALAWFSAAPGPRVQAAFSDDGETWESPVRIDDGAAVGRVDAAMLPDGDLLVSWIEAVEEGAELRVRRVASGGEVAEAVVAATITGDRATGMPRLAVVGGHVYAAWVEPGDPSRLRMARAPLDAVPRQPGPAGG